MKKIIIFLLIWILSGCTPTRNLMIGYDSINDTTRMTYDEAKCIQLGDTAKIKKP